MPCYRPLSAFMGYDPVKGKRSVCFSGRSLVVETRKGVDLPCGQCIGCRLERSRRWAVRLMHEKQLHEKACFLTLTYSDDHLPCDGSLDVETFQKFMKRLRRGSSGPLRFFHCGEYGERTARPHYHCCLFGEDFSSDRELYRVTERGDRLYNSDRLSEVWGLGHAVIGDLTFESAAYVARYVLKKITGEKAEAHYQGRKPEYVTMSRRPGIGAGWFEKFSSDAYPSDFVVMRGKEMMPPPYYDKLLEKADPSLFKSIKKARERAAAEMQDSPDRRLGRLLVQEKVKEETVKHFLRRKV